jgi:hypothetical protein
MTKKKQQHKNNWTVYRTVSDGSYLYSSCFLGYDSGDTEQLSNDHCFEAELKISDLLLYEETELEVKKPVPLGEKKLVLTDTNGREHHVFLTDIPEFLNSVPVVKHGVVKGIWGFKYDPVNETYGLRYVGESERN